MKALLDNQKRFKSWRKKVTSKIKSLTVGTHLIDTIREELDNGIGHPEVLDLLIGNKAKAEELKQELDYIPKTLTKGQLSRLYDFHYERISLAEFTESLRFMLGFTTEEFNQDTMLNWLTEKGYVKRRRSKRVEILLNGGYFLYYHNKRVYVMAEMRSVLIKKYLVDMGL